MKLNQLYFVCAGQNFNKVPFTYKKPVLSSVGMRKALFMCDDDTGNNEATEQQMKAICKVIDQWNFMGKQKNPEDFPYYIYTLAFEE